MDYEYYPWSLAMREAMERDFNEARQEAMERGFNRGKFDEEYLGIPVTVSDGLKVEEVHKKIIRLQDRINGYALAKMALEADNIDLKKLNEELIKENQELRIEVDKIRSRFDILDL